eukprot:TRINITY_DN87487_c0_g1_i1.p1 TRINITY_DN87487_c0_g1~~TRINITY_DN87487_c0_g1_i1.p1  ORF type:complete len:620 (-),score=69.06 TRINITY_DN87487_c0_g1_i1:71-1930(-)
MAGVDSVSSMLHELSSSLGKERPSFPGVGQTPHAYLKCKTWSAVDPSGSDGSLMFGALASCLTRTEHATISAAPSAHIEFHTAMNQSYRSEQQIVLQSEKDFISASPPNQMWFQSQTMIDQADIRERQQQRPQTEQTSISMALPSHGVAQSHVMTDQAKQRDHQQSFSNQGHMHRDAFEEFVLFDRPKTAHIHGTDSSERGCDFEDAMRYHQPKSQTDQPNTSNQYVELKQRSRTDPRHASSLEGVASPPLSNQHSPHASSVLPQMSGIFVDSMHPRFPEKMLPGPSVPPKIETDPDSVSRSPPRIKASPESACNMQLILSRSPMVPEGSEYPGPMVPEGSEYRVDAAPFNPHISQTGTDTVSSLQLMQAINLSQLAHAEIQNRASTHLPTSQIRTGSDNVPVHARRSLSEQALPLLGCPDVPPSIDSIIAMSHQLLREAESIRAQSMAQQKLQACAGPASAELPLALQTVVDDGAGVDSQESESEGSGSDYEVLVGPTELVSASLGLCNLALPTGKGKSGKLVPLISRPHIVAVSDGIRLARAQSFEKPLSFGSALHLMGAPPEFCRPCMFEQRPGRCKKSYCCDFCHVGHHRSQARKAKSAAAKMQPRGKRVKFATT